MKTINACRSCESTTLTDMLDLGTQYTSDFRADDSKPPAYPLEAVVCEECKLVQLRHTTPPEDMYHQNYGFKSGISNSIKDDLHDNVNYALGFVEKPKNWLDIASNDGTLLSFVPTTTHRVGIDPIGFLCEQAIKHADEIITDFFDVKHFKKRQFDVITSISCFYDMDDPNEFVSGVKSILEPTGIWVIQQNYLLPTMEYNAVDNFCHEHLEYYTLLSLEYLLHKHGLEVVDVVTSDVNGGSIRTAVAHKGVHTIKPTVDAQRRIEKAARLDEVSTYVEFGRDAFAKVLELKDYVHSLKKDGMSICILAASTRGATIWQAAGFDSSVIDYAVERNPEKVGKQFSAIGVPIISEAKFRENQPDYAIIGPWFYAEEVIKRESDYLAKGGAIIVPLPELEIIRA